MAATTRISGSATSEAITTITDDNLAWRTIASDTFQSVAIADRVRDLSVAAAEPLKVAAFGKDDAYGKGLLFAVGAALQDELGDAGYFGVVHPDPSSDPSADLNQTVVDALTGNFADADIVLLLGTSELRALLDAYELYLDNNNIVERPLYIMSDGGRVNEMLDFVRARPELANRVEGTITSLQNGTIYAAFQQRYEGTWLEEPSAFAANAYDAAYLVAYGMLAVREDGNDITGAALATMMGRMVAGTEVEAGPSAISVAFTALSSGASINFEGASGSLAFDLSTGEAPSSVNRWIVNIAPDDSVEFADEGQYTIGADGTGEWSIPGEEGE